MNTVQLEGKFFTAHTTQGARVEKGQLLIEFDINGIQSAGFDLATPVVITNTSHYKEINETKEKQIKIGEPLLTLINDSE